MKLARNINRSGASISTIEIFVREIRRSPISRARETVKQKYRSYIRFIFAI